VATGKEAHFQTYPLPVKERSYSPSFVEPMAARLVARLPDGREWLYELKFDGYRALLLRDGERVRLISRNQKDLARSFPSIVAAGKRLSADRVTLDGEIVAIDESGRPSFQTLQGRSQRPMIVFYACDVLHVKGRDLTNQTLEQRRAQLPKVVADSGLLISEELPGTAGEVVEAVRSLGLEGIVAKRRDSVYEPGERSGAWLKFKIEQAQEFVIGGYRPTSSTVDALVVGYYVGKQLRFAAKVRAGFVPYTRREVFEKLKPLETTHCPFVDLPSEKTSRWGGGVTADEMKQFRWLKPEVVAQIRFHEWTNEGRLRSSAFVRLRNDKSAKDVGREFT
jgi:DNA ligase D-like protein (predicted ligase)